MRRREVLGIISATMVTGPYARARIQDRPLRVGVLMAYSESDAEAQSWLESFRAALRGSPSGPRIELQQRWATSPDLLATHGKALIEDGPRVLIAGSTPALRALRAETTSIPIVFANVADPVGQGFAESLARPGGNVTGFGAFEFSLGGKWIQVLKEVSPEAEHIVALYNENTAPFWHLFTPSLKAAASAFQMSVALTPVASPSDIAAALTLPAQHPRTCIVVFPGAMFTNHRSEILQAISRLRIPAVYSYRFWAAGGGLMSYGVDVHDLFRRAGSYVDQILRGAAVADLPIQQPNRLQFVINTRVAGALGISLPANLLARADEVIE